MNKPTLLTRARRFYKAFRQAYVTYDTLEAQDFDDFNGRILRYGVYFSFYENSVYDNLRDWSTALRSQYSLYQYIRNIYNPAYRLAEFWRTVTWGGLLDPEAGEKGAIPIQDASTGLRKAIAATWENSNMALNKDLITLWGTSMGDVGVKIVDDPTRGRVYFQPIHPNEIRDILIDHRGHCQGYVLEGTRADDDGNLSEYVEVCERLSGDTISFKTYKDGDLFAWNGVSPSWTAEYGFVPFAMIRHNYVGGTFGWAEMHPQKSKIMEADEQASKLHDYVRKAIDPVWLFNFKKPKTAPNLQGQQASSTEDWPSPGREEIPALYVPDYRAKAQALITDSVDIEKVAGVVHNVISELERDLPELQMEIWTVGGYTTGKAMRTARQRVEKKVIARRPSYDNVLVRLNGMAVAIGGERGYEGYESFGLGSYKRGELKHTIMTERQVFDTDALEEVERKQTFWSTILNAIDARFEPEAIEEMLVDLGKTRAWAQKFVTKLPKPEDIQNPEGEQDVQDQRTNLGEIRGEQFRERELPSG